MERIKTGLRIKPPLWKRLNAYKQLTGLSLNYIINRAVELYLDKKADGDAFSKGEVKR